MPKVNGIRNPGQSVRLDAKDRFVEVTTNAFGLGKIRINFIDYDKNAEAGSRQKNMMDFYLSPAQAYALAKFIENPGKDGMYQLVQAAKKEQKNTPIWTSPLGGRKEKDGTVICRQFTIGPSSVAEYDLAGTVGEGEVTKTGGIFFKKGAAKTTIHIPMNRFMIDSFAGGLMAAFIGYSAKNFSEAVNQKRSDEDYAPPEDFVGFEELPYGEDE